MAKIPVHSPKCFEDNTCHCGPPSSALSTLGLPQVANLEDKLEMLGFSYNDETDTWSDGELTGSIAYDEAAAWLVSPDTRFPNQPLFVTGRVIASATERAAIQYAVANLHDPRLAESRGNLGNRLDSEG